MKTTIFPVFLAIFLLSFGTSFAQTAFWTLNSKEAVLKGDSIGVAIDDTGHISLAPKITGRFDTEEQFIWSSAVDRAGNVLVGTGGNGKLFRIDKSGKGTLLFDSDDLNIAAVAVGPDGSVYAGTSPDGKVYRIGNDGQASEYFDPQTKYIWSLAIGSDGQLYVGTGETGRIFRVSKAGADAESSVFYDSRETHVICMAVDAKGDLYAGTDSNGLILRIGRDGKAFAVLDSSLREIHEISIGPDGSVYALALSESASTKEPETAEPDEASEKTVSVEKSDGSTPPTPPTPDKSRYDISSSKSVVYRVLPDGTDDIIWASDAITAFAIAADPAGGGVFLGSSEKGRVYRISDTARSSLLIQTEEEQISTLVANGSEIIATTSNKGNSFRFGTGAIDEGTYVSPVLDAKSSAVWGRIWSLKEGTVILETRSGNSARPGETWSDWKEAVQPEGKIASPPARYIQWRARLRSANAGRIRETNLSFSVSNIAPEILSIEVLPPNVGLIPTPEVPIDPNIEALGLNPADFGLAVVAVPPRPAFQTGARSIQWKAQDRNGDRLVYTVFLKEAGDGEFRQIGQTTTDDFVTLDGLTMEDGRYVIKVVVDDSPAHGEDAKRGERISEPFDVDNTPPDIKLEGAPARNGNIVTLKYRANEKSSYIRRAEYSVNGGKWQAADADDGIADGFIETFTIKADVGSAERFIVTIRVFDAVGNVGSSRYVK